MSEGAHSENPYRPVDLSEFGVSVGWAMCRNAMCPNFGIQYAGPAPAGAEIADDRYTINTVDGQLTCRYCDDSFKLNSNRAIRTLARHFLSLSLPFATCPNPACENFGRNAFEHHPTERRVRGRPYRRQRGEHRMRCRLCRDKASTFPLGEALHLSRSPAAKKRLRGIIRGAMYYRSMSMIVEDMGVPEDTYYTQIKRVGARLRDYLAWRNARLLQGRFANRGAPVRVYTDTLIVSLARHGKGARYQHLEVPVSVVDLPEDGTYYVLAAHPGLLPGRLCQNDLPQLALETFGPAHLSPWDCVEHPLKVDTSRSTDKQMKALPDVGRGGWFTVSPYTELAHFLTVRKMLSRFPKVYHYMDAHRAQSAAALTAFADDIRSGRCEIALCQTAKAIEEDQVRERWVNEPRAREDWLKEKLDHEWQEREARWKAMSSEGGLLPDVADDPRVRAGQFAPARDGAGSEGGWAWLRYLPPGPRFPGGRTLWLTQRPDVAYETVGRELLWAASTLPVDRAHSHLRDDVRALMRASFRAEPGRSYRDAYRDPFAVMAEIWIALFWRNFGPRQHPRHRLEKGESPRRSPAWSMGVARSNEPRKPDLATLAWDFRLGVHEAVRMSRWLRQ